jgi:hypothetical protein
MILMECEEFGSIRLGANPESDFSIASMPVTIFFKDRENVVLFGLQKEAALYAF